MDLELAGKTALVAGSSRGIGSASAKILIAEGCRVAVSALNLDGLQSCASAIGAALAIADKVTDARYALCYSVLSEFLDL